MRASSAWRDVLRAVSLGVVLLASTSLASGQFVCRNFQPGSLSTAAIKSEFGGAVLLLKVGGKPSGTGYLIDSSRGYILTANHVIKRAGASAITAESPQDPGRRTLPARIEKAHSKQDLVLLQLTDPAALASIRAIDVSFQLPNEDTVLYATGYPSYGDQPPKDLNTQDVRVIATADSMLQVRQSLAEGGASGGPLLNTAGAAVATAVESVGVGANAARYLPMAWAAELLDDIPLSKTMAEMDAEVRAARMGELVLMIKMVQKSGNPSNLELYAWARRIKRYPAEYTPVARLIKCPVMQALTDRGLSFLVIENTPFAEQVQMAKAYLHLALTENFLARHAAAVEAAGAAEGLFARMKDRQGLASARLVRVSSMMELGLATQARQTLSQVRASGVELAPREKALSYVLAARIEQQVGTPAQALPNYTKAYEAFYGSGNYLGAADASAEKAAFNMRAGQYTRAQLEWERAFNLYGKGNNPIGQSDSLYKIAVAKRASGQKKGFLDTLKQYVVTFPAGVHATEAERLLAELVPSGEERSPQ